MCCEQGTLCFEILKTLPTTLVAVAVFFVARAQYKVTKANLKQDLFDRRFAIFQKLWEILSTTALKGAEHLKPPGVATPFNNFAPEAKFLFGGEVEMYIFKAADDWSTLRALEAESLRPGNAEKIADLSMWFHAEADKGVKKLFDPYLSFEKWK
jgi:hypothetical protein